MNSYLVSKIPNFFVDNLGSGVLLRPTDCAHAVVRNSQLLPAWTQARSVSKDAEALRAILALNLDILPMDGLMSQSTGRARATLDRTNSRRF